MPGSLPRRICIACTVDGTVTCECLPDDHRVSCRSTGSQMEAGACRPVTARVYDPAGDCYEQEQTLPGLCFRETEPDTTTGTWDIVCLVAADGTRYATRKGYTECLEGDGWTTADSYGVGEGWYVLGSNGLCLRDTHLDYLDGGGSNDTLCDATIRRGFWDSGPGGDGHLILLDGGVGPGEAGAYAGECV